MNETKTTISAHLPTTPEVITFSCTKGGGEMLRIAPDGFYVRREKLQQDAAEATRCMPLSQRG